MEQEVFKVKTVNLIRQRNLFASFSICSLAISLLLALFVFLRSEKIILVPGLQQEAWIADRGVSRSYLEENTGMYLPMLLDIDANSIAWKKEQLMRYVVYSDMACVKAFNEYFAAAEKKYKEFSLSTHFALKKLDINPETLTVLAHGELVSRFGAHGVTSERKKYGLSFMWVHGKLLLKEFVAVNEEEQP